MPLEKRICNECRVEKLLGFFPRNKRIAGGFNRVCRDCTNRHNLGYKHLKKKAQASLQNPFT